MHGTGPKIKVFPAAPPPQPSRVQVGGASSSVAPPRERAERGLEEDPRAPYRKFPNAQRVQYSAANPARTGTPRHARYETYKVASTIGIARSLGAKSQDISMDIAAGALVLL